MAADTPAHEPGKEEAAAASAAATAGPGCDDLEDPQFQCCVCLDLLYKPVVISCGHMSCFWCVHKAMHGFRESHCPVCRQPYQHFPSICQLMHQLVLKLEPVDYKRREKEVLEQEKTMQTYSPQITEFFNSKNTETLTDERTEVSKNRPSQEVSSEDNDVDEHLKKVKMEDLSCPLCNELLYQPAVLNCGHVYCISCLSSLNEESIKCQVCGSLHPGDFPNVCLDLDHFLEEYFPAEYESRGKKVQFKKGQCHREGSSSGTSSRTKESSKVMQDNDLSNIHVGVGCDSCGVYPIRGNRYKCQDCTELIGFDLCDACYNSSSKLPGRFNQQHTPDHRMAIDNSQRFPRSIRILRNHEGQEQLVMDEALIAEGAMLQIIIDNEEEEVEEQADDNGEADQPH